MILGLVASELHDDVHESGQRARSTAGLAFSPIALAVVVDQYKRGPGLGDLSQGHQCRVHLGCVVFVVAR